MYTLRHQYQLNCIFDFVDRLLGCHAQFGALEVHPRGGDVVAHPEIAILHSLALVGGDQIAGGLGASLEAVSC